MNKWYLSILLLLVGSLTQALSAQDLGEYVYPFENHKILPKKVQTLENLLLSLFSEENYPGIQFNEKYKRQSLGAKHYTYQVLYQQNPIEQCELKVHEDKEGFIRLIQTNLPSAEEWSTSNFERSNDSSSVYVYHNDMFNLTEKERIENAKADYYADRFWLNSTEYFENSLMYHFDTTVYGKVFLPDPLSSSNQNYGGNYQDGFSFDTSALLIQNLNNPGGNTITANSTSYTYDGQSFNVPTESYVNNFADPVISQVFENIFLDGQGAILGFNTAITNDLSSYSTEIIIEDFNYPQLAQEQGWVSFPADFSNGTFNLLNDFFIIAEFSAPPTNATTSLNDTFNFVRSQLEFEDVNAFYHLNNFKAYWESLGFTDLASQRILVDAHGNNGADNSFFSPTTPPRLVFGQGGVDDAEDADVVIHEYGHAISYFASPGSNVDSERRALDEGFGDYLATSYSKQYSNFNANDVFSWDGHNEFWSGRISNSNKTKQDISANQNIYTNGEVWSTTLNDLYAELGATITDQLAIEVMYYNMPNTTISQAAENLFVADTLLFGGVHSCEIFDVLFARGFLVGTCTDFYSGLSTYYSEDGRVTLLNTNGFTRLNQALILETIGLENPNMELSLISLSGQLIKKMKINTSRTTLNFPTLPGGVYFIFVQNEDASYRFKIMKE